MRRDGGSQGTQRDPHATDRVEQICDAALALEPAIRAAQSSRS